MVEINYRVTTSSLNISRTIRYSPIKGIINSCIFHFPDGCNSLVECFVNIGSKQIFPSPTRGTGGTYGIALNDATPSFKIMYPININDPIELLVINHDELEEHTISAIFYIEEQS